jgi:hypothetical protein
MQKLRLQGPERAVMWFVLYALWNQKKTKFSSLNFQPKVTKTFS